MKNHVYLLLLFLTTTEGPISSFIAAGLAAQGILYLWYVVIIAITGDIIGDIFAYFFGRFFIKLIQKIQILKKIHKIGEQEGFFSRWSEKAPFLYFLLIKITPYIATPSLIYLGIKKMRFSIFFFYSLLTSIIVKAVYLSLGYLGSISLKQLSLFVDGWKQIIIYLIGGILIFWGIKKIYSYGSKQLKKLEAKNLKEEE